MDIVVMLMAGCFLKKVVEYGNYDTEFFEREFSELDNGLDNSKGVAYSAAIRRTNQAGRGTFKTPD